MLLWVQWEEFTDVKRLLYDYNRYCKPTQPKPKDPMSKFKGLTSFESFEHGMNDSGN